MSSSSSLPLGWKSRNNQMSEKDMMLGGIAATKFANKKTWSVVGSGTDTTNNNAYTDDNNTSGVYKSSDDVRDYYLRQMEQQRQQQLQLQQGGISGMKIVENSSSEQTISSPATLPSLWEERQRERDLEARQYGAFSARSAQSNTAAPGESAGGAGCRGLCVNETEGSIPNQNSPSRANDSNLVAATIDLPSTPINPDHSFAHVALVRVATHTLETLADTFEQQQSQARCMEIPMEDRAAFARAIQRAMQALAKSV